MAFAARMTRMPVPYAPDRGQDAARAVRDIGPEGAELITGAAGSSPYLAGLVVREADWLTEALAQAPEDALTGVLQDIARLPVADLRPGLRRLKRRAGLLVALADLGGVWPLHTVTHAWTDVADACTARALAEAVAVQARRGAIPGQTEDDALADGAGMVAFAMGKMGAGELNYSSDIDLICLFDETRFDSPAAEMEARAAFIKATRAMAACLNDPTADGYVFRTDLRLRPDPSVTPVCISMAMAERYYEAAGRTWERSAFIKARPCAGALAGGARFLEALVPFVWRRGLDFAAVAETMDMRQKIRDHKGLHSDALEGRDIKLGPGGIREIEFFSQTHQLVAGGRDPSLRQSRTVKALAALARAGRIPRDTATDLAEHYGVFREIEHRLQMVDDAQTHRLPGDDDGFRRLANLCGQSDPAGLRAELMARFRAVQTLTGALYASKVRTDAAPELSARSRDIVAAWPRYPALRSSRGQEIFERLRPDLLTRLAQAARPDEALASFDGFLRGLPAGVQLFSLFVANPSLVDLICDICVAAPGLAQYLSRNSSVLDAVLDGDFFADWPGADRLRDALAQQIAGADYEAQLDIARRWQKEWHFRVGVHLLRGLITPPQAAEQYSDLGEATVAAMWPAVQVEVARRHGPAPGRGGVVLGMGSLGAREMAAPSDLDLIVIFDAEGVTASAGPKPLDPRGWYAKATKALITALSAPTSAGKLFDVDLRLRPSGQQGPVATSLAAFERYQRQDAWVWEHMALTRARVVAGPKDLAADVEAARASVIAARAEGATAPILQGLRDMRGRLAAAGRGPGGTLGVKEGPGGMQDIVLLAQNLALAAGLTVRRVDRQLQGAAASGHLSDPTAQTLIAVYRAFQAVQQATRLIGPAPLDLDQIGAGGRAFLARITGHDTPEALAEALDSHRQSALDIITAHLGADEGP